MRALIVGDTHGNSIFMKAALDIAKTNEVDFVIQLGDFGWYKTSGENQFIKLVNQHALEIGMPLLVIEGNHDFAGDQSDDQRGWLKWEYNPDTLFEPGLKWIPRNTVIEVDNKKCCFIGGAISVDQPWRDHGVDWWPDEALTASDAMAGRQVGKVDILFTHDCAVLPPNCRKLDFGEKINNEILIQQQRWRQILEVQQPKFHFHGHMHHKYEVFDWEPFVDHTIGLAHESWDALCMFDFEDNRIHWPEMFIEE